MKTTLMLSFVALTAAAAMGGCSPAATDKCPKFSIASEVGKPSAGQVTFTLSPTRDGLTYNWTTSAGTITSGQGTPSVVIEAPAGETVTTTTEVGGLDASCPAEGNSVSSTATLP